ncbi:MAG: PIG-L deacetylase family protein, partial [Bacillota bacterium]
MVSDERHPTLLAVTAHPDDESFLLAGTCARYAESGVRVVLVCATLGEVGRCGNPPVCRPEELGSVRLGELMAACREIGIETV